MILSLKKNFSFALIGNLVYAACQYLILLTFIKVFSTEEVGMFIYAGAFTTPLMMALDMQLRNFYITDPSTRLKLNDYLSFRSFFNLIGVAGLFIAAIFFKPEYLWVIFLVSLIKVFESQIDLIYGVYQKGHRLDYVAYSRVIRGVVALIVVITISFVCKDIIYSLISYFLAWAGLYFFYERNQVVKRGFASYKELKIVKIKKKKLKGLLVLCVPMFFSVLIDKYYLNYPRLKVEDILGVKMLGIFGSLLYFKSVGGQFITAIAHTSMPKLAEYYNKSNRKAFNKLIFKIVSIGSFLGIMLTLIVYIGGTPLLKLLYKPEYADYKNVLVILLLGTTITFSYIFITSGITAMRKQWVRLPISCISFVLMILFFWFFEINKLSDIAIIILITETITLLIYYIVYVYFIKKAFEV